MKYFFLYIFGLVCFIVVMAYWNSNVSNKEGFNPDNQYFLLLGDSVLNNEVYVVNGKSVNQLLKDRTDGKTTCLAKNDANITSVYNQLENLPDKLKEASDKTTIFLSVGGNDIISNFILEKNQDNKKDPDNRKLNHLFLRYQQLITAIQTKMDQCTIRLLNIYYPRDTNFRKYQPIVQQWNDLLQNHYPYNVVTINKYFTNHSDFIQSIEPSSSGGEKLANLLLNPFL